LGVGACTWVFGINKDKEPGEALKIADNVLIALLKGNNLDLKSMLEKDGLIKKNIKKEATYRINFCREETKKAIPKLIKKLPEGVVLDEERIENLTSRILNTICLTKFTVTKKCARPDSSSTHVWFIFPVTLNLIMI